MVSPRPHILNTRPYKPGGKLAASHGAPIMLASNEAPFGPSTKAIEAMQDAASSVHIYPDPNYIALRTAIAEAKGFENIEIILLGAGSDELISLLIHAYAGPGDEVLHTEHAFSMYHVYALSHGATPVSAPEVNLTADVQSLADAVSDRTRICFLANPNNPTGSFLPIRKLQALREALPEDVILAIDGAYLDCMPDEFEKQTQNFVCSSPNTVMIRTFSKLYGLAALRLGWGYFPSDIAQYIQRIRSPFNINAMAVAGGIAAIKDKEFVDRARAHVIEERESLRILLQSLSLDAPESQGNFTLAGFNSPEKAQLALSFLKSQNILVRDVSGYGLPSYLRISIGSSEDMSNLTRALQDFMSQH